MTQKSDTLNSFSKSKDEGITRSLKKTDLGKSFLSHRQGVILAAVLIVLISVGTAAYYSYNKNVRQKMAEKAYQFRQETLVLFQDKKLSVDEFMGKVNELKASASYHSALGHLWLQIGQELAQQEQGEKALGVLAPAWEHYRDQPYLSFLMGVTLATLYENAQEYTKATEILEGLLQAPTKFMEAKLYLDVGRLYQLQGNKEKAKVNFEYVVNEYPQDEMAKLASLYLQRL